MPEIPGAVSASSTATARFIARRFNEELTKTGMPESDEAVTELVGHLAFALRCPYVLRSCKALHRCGVMAECPEQALRLDKEFLDSNQPSGSTGTFVMVQAPSAPGGFLAALRFRANGCPATCL